MNEVSRSLNLVMADGMSSIDVEKPISSGGNYKAMSMSSVRSDIKKSVILHFYDVRMEPPIMIGQRFIAIFDTEAFIDPNNLGDVADVSIVNGVLRVNFYRLDNLCELVGYINSTGLNGIPDGSVPMPNYMYTPLTSAVWTDNSLGYV